MRKILLIIFCSLFLSVPATVQADDNVTNQLEEILVQLDNLDQVIQFFLDNQENFQMLVDADLWNDHLERSLNDIASRLQFTLLAVKNSIKPNVAIIKEDIDSIKADVAALSADLAGYVSQIVASINGVTYEVNDLKNWVINFLTYLLDHPQLDQSQLAESLLPLLSVLENNSTVFDQILQAIQSLDFSYQVADALYNISRVLDDFGNISVYIDLVEELENMDLHFDLDLGTALEGLESDISSISSTLEHFLYVFQNYIEAIFYLKNDQELTNEQIRDHLAWYHDFYWPGLRKVLADHSVWLERQGVREEAEAEFREKRDHFYADDAEFPTGPDVDYIAQTVLKEVELEEPEVPDEKIYRASDKVESDLEEVEGEITGAMDMVDSSVKAFLKDINIRWGNFNSVLSFSFTPPVLGSKYTMNFSYDFSTSELLPPCRAASTGVWAIVLFMESFLAISRTFHAIIEN